MDTFIQYAQLLLSLSILIVLHELGHFIPAKLFGCRVDKFYLFFNPKFSLFKKKIGETEYGIGWVPLGGYVKIAGMIDESMDTDGMKKEPEDWEFRSKPAWQRLIIMVGGVVVNVIVAIVIYGMINLTWGKNFVSLEEINKNGVAVSEYMQKAGFETGDKLLRTDVGTPNSFQEMMNAMLLGEAKEVIVERNGKEVTVPITKKFARAMIKARKSGLIGPRMPFVVDTVMQNSGAAKAGLQSGDYVLTCDGQQVEFFDEVKGLLKGKENKTIPFTVLRGKDTVLLNVSLNENAKMGVGLRGLNIKPEHIEYTSFVKATKDGVKSAVDNIRLQAKSLTWLFDSEIRGYEEVGGFASMAKSFTTEWNWHAFWAMTAGLSAMLALMNILPIPALDGGYVMFILYEIIFRRKPSQRFMERVLMFFILLLFSVMIYVNLTDIVKSHFN